MNDVAREEPHTCFLCIRSATDFRDQTREEVQAEYEKLKSYQDDLGSKGVNQVAVGVFTANNQLFFGIMLHATKEGVAFVSSLFPKATLVEPAPPGHTAGVSSASHQGTIASDTPHQKR